MKARTWLGIGAPLAAGLGLFAFLAWRTLADVLARNGAFTHALDDACIHLAIAKNLALHGVRGVARHAFASASSSPLWTLLPAGANLAVGVRDATPLVLSLLFGGVLLVQAALLARRHGLPPLAIAALLAGLVYALPLAPLAEDAPSRRAWVPPGVLPALREEFRAFAATLPPDVTPALIEASP